MMADEMTAGFPEHGNSAHATLDFKELMPYTFRVMRLFGEH